METKWIVTDEEKDELIEALTNELVVLRAKAGVAQDELAKLIGVSRQTYGSIERKKRKMSWNVYMSLILFFDYNKLTHDMLRKLSTFPTDLVNKINQEK